MRNTDGQRSHGRLAFSPGRAFSRWARASMLCLASAVCFTLLAPALASADVPAGTITTVAGNPTASGLATTIDQNAAAVAPGPGGTMYILDDESSSVRELEANGQEPIVAGDGASGDWGNGGPATAAAFERSSEGITVDAQGDLFVADWNGKVRVVAGQTCSGAANCPLGLTSMTKGDVYVVAGGGASTGSAESATSVSIGLPSGVALDGSGNLLITEDYNSTIAVQVVAATTCSSGASGCPYGFSMIKGDIYTIPATSTGFSFPRGVAGDASGGLLVADGGNKEAKYVVGASCPSGCFGLSGTSAHSVYTIAGGGSTTPANGIVATSAKLGYPEGVAFDSRGDALIADQTYGVWLVAVSNCSSSCPFGFTSLTAGDLYKVVALAVAQGVALDSSGNVLVPEYEQVAVLSEETCSGSSCPYGLSSMTPGHVYVVAGTGAHDSPPGTPAGSAQLEFPGAVAVDSSGDTFIADEGNYDLDFVAGSTCSSLCPFGLSATTAGDLYQLNVGGAYVPAVATDAAGNVLFSNYGSPPTIEIDPRASCNSNCPYGLSAMVAGQAAAIIGGGSSTTSGTPAASVGLSEVVGITVDASGDVIFADEGDQLVRMLAAHSCNSQCPFGLGPMTAGDVYTIAGTASNPGSPTSNVPATSTTLAYPWGVAVDAAGDVVLADSGGSNNNVDVVAAHSCSGSCPYGLATMTAGYIYAIATLPDDGNGVAVDSRGDALVAVSENQTGVELIAASNCTQACPYGLTSLNAGDVYTVAGTGTAGVSLDGGAASAAELVSPVGLALDPHQNLVIADQYDNRIRAVSYAQIDNLQVSLSGPGSGTVSGGGISCGITCEATETDGTAVTLTATAAAGSVFTGWSGGGCSGIGGCVTTLAGDETVTASFAPAEALTVTLAGTGSGTVSGAGITCPGTCSSIVGQGSTVTLTATPASGSTFTGWSGGGCSGTGTCSTTVQQATTITATFTAVPVTPSTAGTTGTAGSSAASDAAEITASLKKALASIRSYTTTLASLKSHGFRALFTAPAAGSARIAWTTVFDHHKVILGTASATFTGKGTRHLTAALSSKGRAIVRLGKRLVVDVSATFAPTVGSAQTLSSRLTVRR